MQFLYCAEAWSLLLLFAEIIYKCHLALFCMKCYWSYHRNTEVTFYHFFSFPFLGTFGNTTGLQNASGCTPCIPGWYCPNTGLSLPYRMCTKGYWCRGGSTEANPVGKAYGVICSRGNYCPVGSPNPVPCPEGFYSNRTEASKVEDCIGRYLPMLNADVLYK